MKAVEYLCRHSPLLIRKSKLPVSLRKHCDEVKYFKDKQKGLAKKPLHKEKPIRQWQHWQIIHNKYPYSAVFKIHHLLVPKREVHQKELSSSESNELNVILQELNNEYDCLLVNFEKKQSIKQHFHIHLLTYKDSRKDLKL